MLGQFLEVARVTADTGECWQQLQAVGFAPASAGDIWPHAYGVVACEGLALGLHALGKDELGVVFVRPEVAALHRELVALDIEVESARLGSDVFNELTLREPGGVALRVLEARTFSPPSRVPALTALGRFVGLSLPCTDIEAAGEFWQSLGYATVASDGTPEEFVITGTPLACHRIQTSREPMLVFDSPGPHTPASVALPGLQIGRRLPVLADVPHQVARGFDLTFLVIDRTTLTTGSAHPPVEA